MWDDAGALGRLTRRLLVLMTFLLIGSGIAWLYNSKYFPVKQIAIQGKLKYASNKELQTVAREHIRGNMFRADIDSAQAAFQELPWIDSAMVRRRFPETVEIILTERVPVAHWRAGGLVDSKGNGQTLCGLFRYFESVETDHQRIDLYAAVGMAACIEQRHYRALGA